MGFARLEDGTAGCEAVVFPKLLSAVEDAAASLAPLVLRGRMEAQEEGEGRLVVDEVEPLRRPPALFLRIAQEEDWLRVRSELESHPGSCLVFRARPGEARARRTGVGVDDPEAVREMLVWLGAENVLVRPGD